jgi:hypothetical protein
MLRLVLAVPAYRRLVDVEHVVQGIELRLACDADARFQFLGFSFADSYSLDWARNRLLHGAIGLGADWLLTVDADTHHRRAPETLRMIADGDKLGAAVIAAPVRTRGRAALLNVRERRGAEYFLREPAQFRQQVTEVDAIGTAFMAISCRWFRRFWPDQPWFVTRHLSGNEPRILSEDLAFCEGVKNRGGRVFVDGRFEPVHVGAEAAPADPGSAAEVEPASTP